MADRKLSDLDWQDSVFDELRVLAVAAMAKEAAGHSLQPTMLVHDAWLKLRDQRNLRQAERNQVLAAGANIIRRLLVDYARKRRAEKRGGSAGRGFALHVSAADDANEVDVIDLHEALHVLSHQHDRAARVVELRFFGGMTSEEAAEHLGVSLRTVNNDWRFAKAWLYRELAADPTADSSD